MKKIILTIFVITVLFALQSCEKVITLKVNDGAPLPYIDAWITDQPVCRQFVFTGSKLYRYKRTNTYCRCNYKADRSYQQPGLFIRVCQWRL